jgi:hypothetical protein
MEDNCEYVEYAIADRVAFQLGGWAWANNPHHEIYTYYETVKRALDLDGFFG